MSKIFGYDKDELEKSLDYIKSVRDGWIIDHESVVLVLKSLVKENEDLKHRMKILEERIK